MQIFSYIPGSNIQLLTNDIGMGIKFYDLKPYNILPSNTLCIENDSFQEAVWLMGYSGSSGGEFYI